GTSLMCCRRSSRRHGRIRRLPISPRWRSRRSRGMQAALAMTGLAPERRDGFWRQIAGDVACVRQRDPAARFTLEILLTYPGVHAVLCYRVAHRLWRWRLRFPARVLSWFARLVSNVDIHPGATIG